MFSGKKAVVMGLGRFGGGVGVSRFLVLQGAQVTVTDAAEADTLAESIAQLQDLPITWHLGEHRRQDFTQADLIVVNPAVRKDSPWLALARQHNITLTSEMNLFFQYCPAPVVGITGSNGKSTTTAMIGSVLQATTRKIWIGGNIGQGSLLTQIDTITPDDIVVLELSSFQLYDLASLRLSPHISVVTNISPNHLDWHGTMTEYVEAKKNILRFQKKNDYALLNQLDPTLRDWPTLTPGRVVWYPTAPDGHGNGNSPQKSSHYFDLSVPGQHNQINASAAMAVGELFQIEPSRIKESLRAFKGLAHRLEFVGEINRVKYYNDSIATTPESTWAAVDAFAEKKILILGGYDKKISLRSLVEKITGNVQVAILIGQVRDTLAQQILLCQQQRKQSLPVVEKAHSLDQAVTLAHQHAQPGMIVLLSPACASYDMFQNFQHRGDQFRKLVLIQADNNGVSNR